MDNMLYRKVLRRAWIIIATLTGITFVAVSLFFPKAGGPSGTTAMLQAVSLQPAGGASIDFHPTVLRNEGSHLRMDADQRNVNHQPDRCSVAGTCIGRRRPNLSK